MSKESESPPPRCEVELDIFSGRPNPTWTLSAEQAETLMRRLASLPPASPRELSGNLGYRGFMVQCSEGAGSRLIRVQKGIVELAQGAKTDYAEDKDRELERWLLNSGKSHLPGELLQIAERDLQ
jgi:hypothetical protein